MKQLFLLLSIAISTSMSAQTPDFQWFVKNGELLNKTTQSYVAPATSPSSPLPIYIEDVKHPSPIIGGNLPRNDFFIIFSDGSHFNSYANPQQWANEDGNYDIQVPNKNYQIEPPVGETIQYMYYTNVYDGDDDPNAIVSNNQPNEFLDVSQLTSASSSSPFVSDNPFSFNHTIVKGRDVTIILNKLAIQESIESCNRFNICWDVPSTVNFTLGESDAFGPSASNLDFTLGLSGTHEVINNCVRNISISQFQGPFAYLNLRAPNQIPFALIGEEIEFSLRCKNGESWSQEVLIEDAHDPNLIDAICLRERKDHYFVEYEFLCTNEMGASPSVSLTLTIPSNFVSLVPSACIINGYKIDVQSINVISSVGTQVLEFPLPLQNFTMGNIQPSSIMLKFCVKYSGIPNYSDPNFTQINGYTTFNSMQGGMVTYTIMNHYNLCGDYEIYYENGYPQVTGSEPWCKSDSLQAKASNSFCDCPCGKKPRCGFLGINCCDKKDPKMPIKQNGFLIGLLALGLIYGAFLVFRKKRS